MTDALISSEGGPSQSRRAAQGVSHGAEPGRISSAGLRTCIPRTTRWWMEIADTRTVELAERSWRLANALRSAGLRKGRPRGHAAVQLLADARGAFRVPAAGGVLVAINNRLASPEVGYILEHSGARILLLDAELEPLGRPAGAVRRHRDLL